MRQAAKVQDDAWMCLGTQLFDILHRNFAKNATEEELAQRQKVSSKIFRKISRKIENLGKSGKGSPSEHPIWGKFSWRNQRISWNRPAEF